MKNLTLIISSLITITFLSCSNDKNKKVDMGIYKIDIPNNWKKIEIQGFDSNVVGIVTSSGDTIISDYGKYSEKFEQTNKIFSKEQILKYKEMKMDTKNLFWSTTPEIDQAQGTFLNEYYMYVTIDNQNVKFRIPKIDNKGITGISIDSLFNSDNRLTIIAKNLKENEKKILIKSFYSLNFNEEHFKNSSNKLD